MAKLIASSLNGVLHLEAFDDMAKTRLEALDLTTMMMYIVDTAPENALFHLASQFNVLGWKGWNIAETIEEKRALVKRAIELKRYAGTPWAIIEAIKTVGFDGGEVHEGVGVNYDGEHVYDGDITYGEGDNWANFRVTINLPLTKVVDAENLNLIVRLINEYQNVRSNLVDITFYNTVTDMAGVSDEIDLSIYDDLDNLLSNEQF